MVQESEVRQKLVELLQGSSSVDDFADWLSAARVNMHLDSAPEAQAFASHVSQLLYQHFDGYLSESALREELGKLVRRVIATYTYRSAPLAELTGTEATSIQVKPALQVA